MKKGEELQARVTLLEAENILLKSEVVNVPGNMGR